MYLYSLSQSDSSMSVYNRFLSCLILIMLVTSASQAQDTKELRKRSGSNDYGEEEHYFVLKSNKKVWHGSYSKVAPNDVRVEEGQYNQGKRSGLWNFYSDQGVLEQIYDYDKDSLLWMQKSRQDLFEVRVNGKIVERKVDHEPFVIGGKYQILREIYKNLDIKTGKSGTYPYIVDCLVNEKGKVEGISLDTKFHHTLDAALLQAAQSVKSTNFIPAKIDGKPVTVIFPLPVLITVRTHQDFRKVEN